MWVLALLFWKRPRLAQNLVIGWLMLVGAELSVIALGQLYLRAVAPGSPHIYPIPPDLLVAAAVAGPLVLILAVCLLTGRRRRDACRKGEPATTKRLGLDCRVLTHPTSDR